MCLYKAFVCCDLMERDRPSSLEEIYIYSDRTSQITAKSRPWGYISGAPRDIKKLKPVTSLNNIIERLNYGNLNKRRGGEGATSCGFILQRLHLKDDCVTAVQVDCPILEAPSNTANRCVFPETKAPTGGSSPTRLIPGFIVLRFSNSDLSTC